MLNSDTSKISMITMIIGLPESTFFLVVGAFGFCALLLLGWALLFKDDINGN